MFSENDVPLITSPGLFSRIKSKVTNSLGNNQGWRARAQQIALVKYIKVHGIDAILAEYGPTGVAVMDACDSARVPLVVHFHGFDAFQTRTLETYGNQYSLMFKRASAIVAVSHDMKDQLISLGAPSEKVYYNPYGVDVSWFHNISRKTSQPTFLFIGRFVNKKAPHLLILAFAKVKEAIPNARLVLGGDGGLGSSGELYSACIQLVRALKLTTCVDFRGPLTHEEVRNEMQKSFAYVQHSVQSDSGDSEGMPNSILEAAASGLPVVATRHAGIKEVIKDDLNGYLVEEYDVDGMTKRMIDLALNPELATRMGQAARKRIEEEFTREKSISRLSEIIDQAIIKFKHL